MNPKTVVILVLLLAIAGAILFTPQFMTPSDGPHYDTTQDIPAIPEGFLDADLQSMTIPTGERSTNLEKRAGRWWVTHPHEFPANTQKVNRFLQRISEITVTPPGTPIADAIPNPPPPVYLTNTDSSYLITPWRRLGAGRTIIEVSTDEGEFQYNANDVLHKLLESLTLESFYDTSPLPLILPDIARIKITAEGKSSTLQQADGKWWIGDPSDRDPALEQALSDAPGVSTYIELHNSIQLNRLQFYPLHESRLAGFGLDRPLVEVVFEMSDGQAWKYAVGVPSDPEDKTRYVSYGPIDNVYPAVFTLDTPIALAFAQDAKVFRDPRIVDIPAALIERIDTKPPPIENEQIQEQLLFFETNEPPYMLDEDRKRFMLSHTACNVLLKKITASQATQHLQIDHKTLKKIRVVTVRGRLGEGAQSFGVFEDPESTDDSPTVLIRRGLESVLLRVPRESIAGLLDPLSLVAEENENGGE